MEEVITKVYARKDGAFVKMEAVNVDSYPHAIQMAKEHLGVGCALAVVRKEVAA